MGGGGKTLKQLLHRPLHKHSDPGSVQSNHVPCEPALIECWMPAKHVNCLTAKLVSCLTAKLMNCLTTKLVDHLTAKLVVVNLVKLHLSN